MAGRKKIFPCGHAGYGKFCHKCKQVEDEKTEKEDWNNLFSSDEVNLRELPNKHLVLKARKIIQSVISGAPYQNFGGKKMNYDRRVISVPINADYRVLFKETEQGLKPFEVLSHEEYNRKKPGASKV